MIPLDPDRLHGTLRELAAALGQDPGFAAELTRARREFFGGSGDDYLSQPADRAAGEARFQEWYLLERDSERLGDVPVRVLGGIEEEARDALVQSRAGLFLVRANGDEIVLRDLQGDEEFVLLTDLPVAVGDLVVGRLFPSGAAWLPSPAAVLMRDAGTVVQAIRGDLRQLALGRALSQAELETLWFRRIGEVGHTATQRVSPERIEARLASILREGGADIDDVPDISTALREAREGPGPVIGPLLDELAFHSNVDLEQAREALLTLWNEHRLREQEATVPRPRAVSAPVAGASAPPGRPLGQTLADRIEQGLADGEDVEQVFRSVEQLLGESLADDDDDEEDDGSRPQGDLEPLVAEFLWEREHHADSAHGVVLREFLARQLELPLPGVWVESLSGADLVRFLLRTFLSSPPGLRADRVRAEHSILHDFLQWCMETQEFTMQAALRECEAMLLDDLERVHRASVALSTASEPTADGPGAAAALRRVAAVDGHEVELVEGSNQPGHMASEPLWVSVQPTAAANLRTGDFVLGPVRREPGGQCALDGLVLVLPPAVGPLLS